MIEFDFSYLRGKIVEKYKSQHNFAKCLGKSNAWLSAKLNGEREFKISEMYLISQLLLLNDNQINKCFFSVPNDGNKSIGKD